MEALETILGLTDFLERGPLKKKWVKTIITSVSFLFQSGDLVSDWFNWLEWNTLEDERLANCTIHSQILNIAIEEAL